MASVDRALKRFTRGRLLANLAATSPLFRDLAKPERRALMTRFQPRRVGAGDILIEEGEAGRGLYVVVSGRFGVETRESARLTTWERAMCLGRSVCFKIVRRRRR